jgi:hypothetical protein
LLLIFDIAVVFDLVVFLHVGDVVADWNVEHALELHIDHPIESQLAVVGHDDGIAECLFDFISLLLFVSDLGVLVDSVNDVHDSVFSDYFSGSVHPEENSFLALRETRHESFEHVEVVDS